MCDQYVRTLHTCDRFVWIWKSNESVTSVKSSNLFVTPVKNSCDFFTLVTNTCESFTSVKDTCESFTSVKDSHEFFTSVIRTHDMCDKYIKKESGWLGRVIVLGSVQCRGVLLLWHIERQGPAVLAAGAGRMGCFLYFLFHLVYPIFLFWCLICWETAGHSEILWSRPL